LKESQDPYQRTRKARADKKRIQNRFGWTIWMASCAFEYLSGRWDGRQVALEVTLFGCSGEDNDCKGNSKLSSQRKYAFRERKHHRTHGGLLSRA
jgi:hypothetical protein